MTWPDGEAPFLKKLAYGYGTQVLICLPAFLLLWFFAEEDDSEMKTDGEIRPLHVLRILTFPDLAPQCLPYRVPNPQILPVGNY